MADIPAVSNPLIMVVDNDPANLLIGTLLLDEFGYDYIVAENGLDAIEIYKTNKISLVLMDLQMPRMSGFEATARIRGLERDEMLSRVPIIAVSANIGVKNQDVCSESDMDGFLRKPYTPEELGGVIRLHLDGASILLS